MTFDWQGNRLALLDHGYNDTATNERAVEVPIAWSFVRGGVGTDRLEFGNVLAHYGDLPARRIVDRYEAGAGVENVDLFTVAGSFDWIVSISTVEHVRHDELPRTPGGAAAALVYLRGLLAPGGRMLVTVGLGQHHALDTFLFAAEWPGMPRRATTLVRDDGRWHATPTPEWRPYGPVGANAVWVGEW